MPMELSGSARLLQAHTSGQHAESRFDVFGEYEGKGGAKNMHEQPEWKKERRRD